MTSRPVRKLARITAKPGKSQALREALRTLESATRQEPGCLEFSFYQALTAEGAFLLLERFADQRALQAHMELPHTRTFFRAGLTASVDAVDLPSVGSD